MSCGSQVALNLFGEYDVHHFFISFSEMLAFTCLKQIFLNKIVTWRSLLGMFNNFMFEFKKLRLLALILYKYPG